MYAPTKKWETDKRSLSLPTKAIDFVDLPLPEVLAQTHTCTILYRHLESASYNPFPRFFFQTVVAIGYQFLLFYLIVVYFLAIRQ